MNGIFSFIWIFEKRGIFRRNRAARNRRICFQLFFVAGHCSCHHSCPVFSLVSKISSAQLFFFQRFGCCRWVVYVSSCVGNRNVRRNEPKISWPIRCVLQNEKYSHFLTWSFVSLFTSIVKESSSSPEAAFDLLDEFNRFSALFPRILFQKFVD